MVLSRNFLNLVLCAVAVTAQDFDYLIIGGGASGSLFAGKLAANPNLRVGILEAGLFQEQNTTLVPELFSGFIGNPDLDWGFQTVPQKNLGGNVLALPRGKALGGTAAVNGMFFVRGSKPEYDAWEKVGNPGWNWNNVSAHIKSVETFTPAPPEIAKLGAQDGNHGTSGPINVTFSNYYSTPSIIQPFYDAMNTLGVPRNTQPSAGNTVGVYQVPTAVDHMNRTRSYAVNGFVTPLQRKGQNNLVINTGALVTKVIFAPGTPLRATGVEFVQNGVTKTLKVKPTGKVVIAAGTYQTPKLLELSGIGQPKVLKQLGIPVLNNLTGVGENLQDHIGVLGTWEIKPEFGQSLDALLTNGTFATQQWTSYIANRTGAYASIPASTVAFFPFDSVIPADRLAQLKKGLDARIATYKGTPLETQLAVQRKLLEDPTVAQIELVITSQVQSAAVKPEAGKSYVSIAANIGRPFSRGSVHAVSKDPTTYAAIDVNFLDFDFDYQVMQEAFSFVLNKLTKTAPFSNILKTQLAPPANTTAADLPAFVKANLYSVWHPVGSASMLPLAQNGVVDSHLKVYGTQNLHVIDACLIPMSLSTHSMSTVYGNAAFAADLLA